MASLIHVCVTKTGAVISEVHKTQSTILPNNQTACLQSAFAAARDDDRGSSHGDLFATVCDPHGGGGGGGGKGGGGGRNGEIDGTGKTETFEKVWYRERFDDVAVTTDDSLAIRVLTLQVVRVHVYVICPWVYMCGRTLQGKRVCVCVCVCVCVSCVWLYPCALLRPMSCTHFSLLLCVRVCGKRSLHVMSMCV